jgi:hypothetical protein
MDKDGKEVSHTFDIERLQYVSVGVAKKAKVKDTGGDGPDPSPRSEPPSGDRSPR